MTMRFLALLPLATALTIAPQVSGAQRGTAPRLQFTEELRLDIKKDKIERTAHVSIAPDGRVFVAPSTGGGHIVAFDSSARKQLWRVGVGFNSDYELRLVNRIGWTGNQMWVADRGYNHVVLINDKGVVTKSIENPPFARPTLGQRHKFPIFEAMDPVARYADGTMLVRPRNATGLFDTPEFDTTSTHLLLVSPSGVIKQSVARYQPERFVKISSNNRTFEMPIPLQNRTLWQVSPDGTRLLFASASMSGKDSATIHVAVLNERGDTLFVKRLPFVPERIAKRVRDSVSVAAPSYNNVPVAEVRAQLDKQMPPFYPPLRQAFIAKDHSVWLAFRAPPADSMSTRWLVLDPRGEPIGTASLDRRVNLLAADRGQVWGVEFAGPETKSVVRYRLGPETAKPKR